MRQYLARLQNPVKHGRVVGGFVTCPAANLPSLHTPGMMVLRLMLASSPNCELLICTTPVTETVSMRP